MRGDGAPMPQDQASAGVRHALWSRLPPLEEPSRKELRDLGARILVSLRRDRSLGSTARWILPASIFGLVALHGGRFESDRGPSADPPSGAPSALAKPALPEPLAAVVGTPEAAAPPRAIAAPPPIPALPAPRPRHLRAIARGDAESGFLARALESLHGRDVANRGPQGALSVIQDYRHHFPHGDLRDEALVIETEALLRLGRRETLVENLEDMQIAGLPREAELCLLRAEALAKLERCSEAIPVFSTALRNASEPSLRERALFGRALCEERLGRVPAARSDYERDLSEFPDERVKARRALDRLSE